MYGLDRRAWHGACLGRRCCHDETRQDKSLHKKGRSSMEEHTSTHWLVVVVEWVIDVLFVIGGGRLGLQ